MDEIHRLEFSLQVIGDVRLIVCSISAWLAGLSRSNRQVSQSRVCRKRSTLRALTESCRRSRAIVAALRAEDASIGRAQIVHLRLQLASCSRRST